MPAADTIAHPAQSPQARRLPLVFWLLLALTASVRLGGVTRPLLGNFATKNVVYAMVARNFAEGNASLWYPTLDVIKGGQRSLSMVEFPVSSYLTGWLWKKFGGSLDVWGRATAVAFGVASVAVMFVFVRRRHGQAAATAAALVVALSPISIIYGQSFMLEASLVFFTVATFYALDRSLDEGQLGWLGAATVCLAMLLLTKIYMIVVLLPLSLVVVSDRSISRVGRAAMLGGLALAILPAALWYSFAYQAASPDGPLADRVYFSVRRSAADHRPPSPLLWSPDFYRRLLDNLAGVVLTPVGFMLAVVGLLDRAWRRYAAWLLAMALLVAVLPRKFYEMNYYYMAVLLPLSILAGLGWQALSRHLPSRRAAAALLLLVAGVFSLRYALRPAFVTPDEDRGVIAAASAVRNLTDHNEPIVTMHGTTIDLLYYCRRPGWALSPDAEDLEATLADCRRQGARCVVAVGHDVPGLAPPLVQGEDFRVWALPGVTR